ncbi:IS607 family transposase [Nitrospira sp. Kam-Ns4a]
MKLSDWAKKQGVSYRTVWNWFRLGKLPIPARQLPSGTIIVQEASEDNGIAVIYARVSSSDQRPHLDGQVARCLEYANARGLSVSRTVTEIGSGLNGHRKKLMHLLADPRVKTIIVEHRDRLMRFGAEYVEAALTARGARVLVVDESELQDDLVQDMIAVLTSFCARLYGRRSAKNRAKNLIAACREGG